MQINYSEMAVDYSLSLKCVSCYSIMTENEMNVYCSRSPYLKQNSQWLHH